MTDAEIITALGYCKRSVGAIICTNNCPMYNECDSECPQEDICGLALDLINRQKAEIERYLHSIKILENDVQTAKSEAIKEFADRLKDKADKTRIYNIENEKVVFYMDEFKLDKLVKEMTEGQDDGK